LAPFNNEANEPAKGKKKKKQVQVNRFFLWESALQTTKVRLEERENEENVKIS
jgi:hypothetical protein